MNAMRIISIVATALFLAGCGSTKSFKVEVKNQSSQPVTLWLMKDGPPAEDGWRSPEELGLMPQDSRPTYDLAIIPPGKTGYTDRVSGKFPSGTHALLRIYAGELELYHMLQAERGGKAKRADVPLKPGDNRFTVADESGNLIVQRN